ncbi:adenosylcobinamide-GDP ribazoletransferase [Citreimonas salinaria]|uniref:Adenosylcobinamide-GDP ribazoletransferase n=1 Tax=Citreimonas salinaria TaxID=321339 RepID=A0A1H3GA32_9RHOB|nr:adenosylcobinamide-GDP ribazoletransferase [Citreimonas salinaria]SDY00193.1 cobalamin-5'-phosphate synthase [Citreimonas salinaria]
MDKSEAGGGRTRRIAAQWRLFLLALQFLTRLPVPRDLDWCADAQRRAVRYYPAVGVVVGILGAAVLALSAQAWPTPLAVLMSLAATLIATGAMHEDGLADAADGLVGGATRERALEIMRDSRIGTYGALALGVALALKVAALAALPLGAACLALVAAHALGRGAAVWVIATTTYARTGEAAAKFPAPGVSPGEQAIAMITLGAVLLATAAGLGPAVLAGLVCAAAPAWAFRRLCRAKLGGHTGDCLGGIQQLAEIGFYLGLVAWL